MGATLDEKYPQTLSDIKNDGKRRRMITDMSDARAARTAP